MRCAAPYSSYTEEEFYLALKRYEREQKPSIIVFFKHIDPGQMADPGPQLKKVLAFRKKLEKSGKVLYRMFDEEKSFRLEMDKHLTDFVERKRKSLDGDVVVQLIPSALQPEIEKYRAELRRAIEELESLRAEAIRAKQDAEQVRATSTDPTVRADAAGRVAQATSADQSLAVAEHAAKSALDGRIEEARQAFAKALDGTTNTRVLFLGFEFFERIGELAEAERLARRALAISGPDAEIGPTADAYNYLGRLLLIRGDINGAETMLRRALVIFEKLGQVEGMAKEYGNLGLILQTRGDLEGAEAMHRKALDIDEKLGRLEHVATHYGNLGLLLRTRGDLDEAEVMHCKSLGINEKLGRLEGMAVQYGNLGLVSRSRGDLERAEAMHRKALEIDEKLGRLEGMATHYGNLGVVLEAAATSTVPKGCTASRWRSRRSSVGSKALRTSMATWASSCRCAATWMGLRRCTASRWRSRRNSAGSKAWPAITATSALS